MVVLRRVRTFSESTHHVCLTLYFTDTVQLLLHGSTYSSQYWFWQLDGYEQYSYVNHACEQGHAVFAYDGPGVGRSFRPQSSTDIQLQSMGYVAVSLAKMLKTGQLTLSLGLLPRLFSHVVAIGHSQGSVMFCYVAIAYTNAKPALKNPFDGLILTGHIHDTVFYTLSLHGKAIANQANPARWGSLDDGYVTTPAGQRNVFYPPDADMFDPNVLELDEITKDISSGSIARGLTYHPAPAYRGPVVELIGSKDQQHCTDANGVVIECVQSTLQVSEAPYWPASTNFTVVVRPGSGHDVNMDFGAPGTFDIITGIVNAWDRSHFH